MAIVGNGPRDGESRSAGNYDDRTTAAVKSVLVEIGQILGSFRGKFVVIGGVVPSLLLNNDDMPHIGTTDVDLDLDAEALGNGEYAEAITTLIEHGYFRGANRRRFQLVRQVIPMDGGPPIKIIVDFLMPRDAKVVKNRPPLVDDFAVMRADGARLALQFHEMLDIDGSMPEGGINRVSIAVASIPALLAMKGLALDGRSEKKDAYDIYYCVRNFLGGPNALAEACRPLLKYKDGIAGYEIINEKFKTIDHLGPTFVRQFVEETSALQGRTPDQWQQDAFGQIDTWLRAIGLRE